jgi:hypothetical protein
MKPSRGARSWTVFLIVVLTVGTGIVLWKLPGVTTRISAAAAALGIGSSIVGYLRSWCRARPVPTVEQASNAREALAGLVAAQWRREATIRAASPAEHTARTFFRTGCRSFALGLRHSHRRVHAFARAGARRSHLVRTQHRAHRRTHLGPCVWARQLGRDSRRIRARRYSSW